MKDLDTRDYLQICELTEAEIGRVQATMGILIQLYAFFVAVVAVVMSTLLQDQYSQLSKLTSSEKLIFVAKVSFFYIVPVIFFMLFALRCLRRGPFVENHDFENLWHQKVEFRKKILNDFRNASFFLILSLIFSLLTTFHIFATGHFPI